MISNYCDPGECRKFYSGFSSVPNFGTLAGGDFGVVERVVEKGGTLEVMAEGKKTYRTLEEARERAAQLNLRAQGKRTYQARRA